MTDTDLALPEFLDRTNGLPAMVDRAARTLASANSAATILEARELASVVYDAAKRAARLAQAKGAHDELLSKIHRAQADALEIEAGAKRRLADEYDAAQERGEVAGDGRPKTVPDGNGKATAADVGLSRKQVHEARQIRDAENAKPGIVRRAIDAAMKAGEEPTRAKVRRAVQKARPDPAPRPARGKDAICHRVREAIVALSGLPPPLEVIGYLRGTDNAVIVDEHLRAAARWFAEFSELWPEEATGAEAA